MTDLSSRLILRLIDGVTGPAKRVVGSLRGITATARTSTLAAARSVNNISKGVTAGLGGLGLYKAHTEVLKFATAANKLAAANPDFRLEEIREVSQLARDVSRQTLFDPATVLDAANALARADVSIQAIKGTLKPLATAAMAADVPVSDLADSFVKLASNFGMSLKTREDAAKTFTYLGDLATYVGQRAPGTFNDYVQAMVKVGAAARTAGIDIRFLSGAYIMLDKAGIRNEEAGTALRSLVKSLVQPTAAARKMYAQLGIDPASFLKGGRKVTAEQMVAGFQSEYGKDLAEAAPRIQTILDQVLSSKDKGNALFDVVQKMWGDKMRPVDARKVKKSIDNFMFSATEKIDPQAWINALADKGVTLGQFIRLIEPRQASRLINLLKQQVGDEEADKRMNQPLSELPGFREGLAAEAGGKMMQGYPAAVKKISDAFQSLIEALDKSGAIDAFSTALRAVGDAVIAISQGTAGWKEWLTAIAAAMPIIAGLTPVITGLVAAIGLLIATPAGLIVAFAALVAAVVVYWKEIKEYAGKFGATISETLSSIDLYDVGTKIMTSLWNGLKSTFSNVLDFFSGIGGRITSAIGDALPALGIGPKDRTPGKGEKRYRQNEHAVEPQTRPIFRETSPRYTFGWQDSPMPEGSTAASDAKLSDQSVTSAAAGAKTADAYRRGAADAAKGGAPSAKLADGSEAARAAGEKAGKVYRAGVADGGASAPPEEGLDKSDTSAAAGTRTGTAFSQSLEDALPKTWPAGSDPAQFLDQSGAAGSAGAKTAEAFKANFEAELRAVDQVIQQAMQRWGAMLGSFRASPSITPSISTPTGGGSAAPAGGQKLGSLENLSAKQQAAFADYGFRTV